MPEFSSSTSGKGAIVLSFGSDGMVEAHENPKRR
jgi:hypothetical protein